MSESSACPHSGIDPRQHARKHLVSREALIEGADESELKPRSTAAFSELVSQIVNLSVSEPSTIQRHPLRNKWHGLRLDMRSHMITVTKAVLNDPSNIGILDELHNLQPERHQYSPISFVDPRQSLIGGIDTGVNACVALTQDLHEKAQVSSDHIAKLHASHRPIFMATSGNPVQLFALSDDIFPKRRLPPVIDNGHSLDYKTSLMDIPLTTATRRVIRAVSAPQPMAHTVGDLTYATSPTIGCPIVLNPNNVTDLWHYTVNTAEQHGLLQD